MPFQQMTPAVTEMCFISRARAAMGGREETKNLDEIDHNILNVLFSSKGNILEDENAIKNLSGFKVMTTEISEKQESLERSYKRIKESREE